MDNISKEQALSICEQVRAENHHKWYTYQAWWCWGCTAFTKGDPAKRCFAATPDNRGCLQVNKHLKQTSDPKTQEIQR
ncbi:MAG: hypothetical protein JW726_13525 [Anaerolineales bacterium]|nr:hypothetical protein [Anaerolineales bacterium]